MVSTAITSMFRWKSGPVLGFLLGNQSQRRLPFMGPAFWVNPEIQMKPFTNFNMAGNEMKLCPGRCARALSNTIVLAVKISIN